MRSNSRSSRFTSAAACLVALVTLTGVGNGKALGGRLGEHIDRGPPLPSKHIATLVRGQIVLTYCFQSMPKNPHRRPALLNVGVDNRKDGRPPLTIGWRVVRKCGVIRQRVGPIDPPYVVLLSVSSQTGRTSRVIRVLPSIR